jgi:hypothetical protein
MKMSDLPITEASSREAETVTVALVIGESRMKNEQSPNKFNLMQGRILLK